MLWIKALHVAAMVTWFAGLFYLPRLFVYHAQTREPAVAAQFQIMERRLYYGITTPGGVLTIALGLWLWWGYGIQGTWLAVKLVLVGLLVAYHIACGKYLRDFRAGRNRHGHRFYRWFNELPTVLLLAVVILAVVKPF